MDANPTARTATPDSAAAHARSDLTMPPPAAGPKGWARRVALAGMVAPAGFFTVMMVLGWSPPATTGWPATAASLAAAGSARS